MPRMTISPAIADEAVHTLYGETMGTRWRVALCASRHAPLPVLHAGIQSRLDAVVAQMSTWEPDSDISRFNRAPPGSWHVLPEAFSSVLSSALTVARESGGAFDPTVGPMVAAWGFGAGAGPHRIPDEEVRVATMSRVGWHRILHDAASRRAMQPGGIALDLSAIAKGFAVDDVVSWLRHAGIPGALVDVGGELLGYGRKPDDSPWHVLVETDDADDHETPCVLVLDNHAVATSGTRWHRFECDGREYAHTIDPRTGRPVEDAAAAVTVVATDAMHADAWATALTVMGIDAGLAFASANDIAARFVRRYVEGDAQPVLSTRAFDAFCAP